MTPARRIVADYSARIRSGDWRPGHRLPNEQAIAADYACARATAGKAMAELVAAGLVERRRKAGSFVAHPRLEQAALAVPDIARIVADRGEDYAWRLTRRDLDGETLHLEGIHLAGGDPFAVERRTIALAAVPAAADEGFERDSPGSWLLAHVPWSEASHRIDAVPATATDARALGIPRGSACLRIARETWAGGQPVTQVTQVFPGDRYALVARFNPSQIG